MVIHSLLVTTKSSIYSLKAAIHYKNQLTVESTTDCFNKIKFYGKGFWIPFGQKLIPEVGIGIYK